MRAAGIHHVAVQVRDLPAAEAFYTGVLGLRVARRWPGEAGERSLWLDAGGGTILMLERAGADERPPSEAPFVHPHAGWHVVALRIEASERSAWEARLGERIVHRTRWTVYVRDPDGNRVGLSHYPEDRVGA